MTKAKKRTFEVYDHGAPPVVSEVLSISKNRRVQTRSTTVAAALLGISASPDGANPMGADGVEEGFFEEVESSHATHEAGLQGVEVVPAKRYSNSDRPLSTWRKHASEYLDELMRLDGRGLPGNAVDTGVPEGACRSCGAEGAEYRCKECHCGGLVCVGCLKAAHRPMPLHVVERWSGVRFETTPLRALGLRVQVGHDPCGLCPSRVAGRDEFVVLHTNGIHLVAVDFCGCSGSLSHRVQLLRASWWPATPLQPQTCATMALLRQFHALNLQGKLSAYDCYKALDLQTNGAGLQKLPDRLPMFMLMIREWRFTKMLKRAGRGLDPTGIAGTKQGELAIKCPACPRPGVNLPSNWMDAPPEKAFLYWLVLAMDANFRLKSRLRTSEDSDPPLGSGFAYFVESKTYGQYVVEHTSEEEISTCVAFAALATANLKQTKGLASTGVGAVTCGRHQFWRANGLGDLQKGERYLNMDYIFLSTLMDVIVKTLVSSYDLACQWKKKFWQRVANFPNAMQESLSDADVVFLVPEFHLQAHKEACHSAYSSRRTVGMGRSELEGPERNWAWLNGAAASTKEMGPGSRRDTLDDFCGFSNWRRVVGMGSSLLRKMLEAIPNAITFHHAYKEMDDGLRGKRPEQVEEWDAMFAAWNDDKENNPSPFTAPRAKKSMQEIRQELKEEEHAALGQAMDEESDASASSFLLLGLELEQTQRSLRHDLKLAKSPTTLQISDIDDRRRVFMRRVRRFRRKQAIHMPGLQNTGGDDINDADRPALDKVPAEEVELQMPSDLDGSEARQAACSIALADVEVRLRTAEAEDALDDLRRHLQMRSYFNNFKVNNVVGQGPHTRARQTQTRIDERVKLLKLRYQHAYRALMRLTGGGSWTSYLRELKDADVRTLREDLLDIVELPEGEGNNEDTAPSQDLARRGRGHGRSSQIPARQGRGKASRSSQSQGKKPIISWIWHAVPTAADENDPALQNALRVEWSKAKVRAARWEEEVEHVEEEMRRVLETFATEASLWADRSARRDASIDSNKDKDQALKEGVHAYAAEQAAMYRGLATQFSNRWAAVRVKARPVLDGSAYTMEGDDEEGPPVTTIELELGVHDEDYGAL